jgi:FtsP/CotA-like multicopper oxidase with cupredoxin domain
MTAIDDYSDDELDLIAHPDRREFLGLALTAAGGILLTPLFPRMTWAAKNGDSCPSPFNDDLLPVGELKAVNGFLRGIIDARYELRKVIQYAGTNAVPAYKCRVHPLRAYHGYQGFGDPKKPVTKVGVAYPGPTLRARVGETVQLIFLNHIDPSLFPSTSVTSASGKCDSSFQAVGGKRYPGATEGFPNCFHASNTTNLHFHGTHVTPGTFGDNVLIGVLPNPKMDVAAAVAACKKIFDAPGHAEHGYSSKILQNVATLAMKSMLEGAKKSGNIQLDKQIQAAMNANRENILAGEWPQYWPGFYVHHFQLPLPSGVKGKFPVMGQSPGTHWYHCHQHGSTTMQILNGMAGLFIITGDYDDKLLVLGGGTVARPKIKEQVMIFQLFAEQPNLVNPTLGVLLQVNGQVVPTVRMKRGEVQWWRIANAAMKAHGIDQYLFVSQATLTGLQNGSIPLTKGTAPPSAAGSVPSLNQTAQDGVQFDWSNYTRLAQWPSAAAAPNPTPNPKTFHLSPGNRADFLVKAPATDGTAYLVFWPQTVSGPFNDINENLVLKVIVDGDATNVNTSLPTQAQYPKLPDDLADITDEEINERHRKVTFSMSKGSGTGGGNPVNPPQFYIDGKQFEEGIINQIMLLGTAEEWTLVNTSQGGVSHPFHIHINPFQITEIFDPSTMTTPQAMPQPWVWGDVISIPASAVPAGGTVAVPGHVKIRSRFVDFPGKFVLHCHILGHEDRGMMQLVEVVDNHTVIKHH